MTDKPYRKPLFYMTTFRSTATGGIVDSKKFFKLKDARQWCRTLVSKPAYMADYATVYARPADQSRYDPLFMYRMGPDGKVQEAVL